MRTKLFVFNCLLPSAIRPLLPFSRRLAAEDLSVQGAVIIPPIHVARNVGGGDGHAQDFFAVSVKQAAQAALRVECQQFITEGQID